jgi:hypothetical protein
VLCQSGSHIVCISSLFDQTSPYYGDHAEDTRCTHMRVVTELYSARPMSSASRAWDTGTTIAQSSSSHYHRERRQSHSDKLIYRTLNERCLPNLLSKQIVRFTWLPGNPVDTTTRPCPLLEGGWQQCVEQVLASHRSAPQSFYNTFSLRSGHPALKGSQ